MKYFYLHNRCTKKYNSTRNDMVRMEFSFFCCCFFRLFRFYLYKIILWLLFFFFVVPFSCVLFDCQFSFFPWIILTIFFFLSKDMTVQCFRTTCHKYVQIDEIELISISFFVAFFCWFFCFFYIFPRIQFCM